MADRPNVILAAAFEDPGGLRDLVVVDADDADWRHLLAWLAGRPWPTSFHVDGVEVALPSTFDQAYELRQDHEVLLSIDVGGIAANCHFWNDREIELDIAARDVQTDPRLDALVDFMKGIASALGRPVRLTEDSVHDIALSIVTADGEVMPG